MQKIDKLWVATKAFIEHKGKILVLCESGKYTDGTNEGTYDVVGGRLTPGEHFKEALHREVKEETGLDVEIKKPFYVNEWRPNVKGEQWQIVGIFFTCTTNIDRIILSKDHDSYKWIEPQDYESENLIKNLYPAFKAYLENN